MGYLNILACPENLGTIVKFVHSILTLIQIVVPIILIIVGAFDLAKAVMGNDEKEIKAATQKLIKRAIAAVAVFFIVTLVTIVISYVSDAKKNDPDGNENDSWTDCWNEETGATTTDSSGRQRNNNEYTPE